MKRNTYNMILGVAALALFGAVYGLAQTGHQHEHGDKQAHHDMSTMDMSSMMNEPHHVLAVAYLQTVGTFAKALGDQAQTGNQLSSDFARAAVGEMRRCLDQADEHHQEHMKTMSEDMRSKMSGKMPGMTKETDTRRSPLGDAVSALENDVQNYTLNSKQIAADCTNVLKQLDEISKMLHPE